MPSCHVTKWYRNVSEQTTRLSDRLFAGFLKMFFSLPRMKETLKNLYTSLVLDNLVTVQGQLTAQ